MPTGSRTAVRPTNGDGTAGAVRFGVDDRPVAQVVGDIVQNVNALARAEARLAVAEVVTQTSARAKIAGKGAGIAAAGGVIGLLALGFLLASAAAALALVVATWLAILIVGAVAGIGAWIAISLGARHLRRAFTSKDAAAPQGARENT